MNQLNNIQTSSAGKSRIFVVIPAFNEAPAIGSVVQKTRAQGFENLVVVDDGSNDRTSRAARASGAQVVRHALNRGKGAATKTGISAALRLGADIIVTMDGDGQHDPQDITALIRPLQQKNFHVSLGVRSKKLKKMPLHKIIANIIGNLVTYLLFRLWVSDSQSGFRAYTKEAARLISPKADYYDFESEVIKELRQHHIPYVQVPITVHYTPYSQLKGTKQSLGSSITTLYKMLWNLLS